MINPHRPQTTPKFPYIHWAGWPFHLRRVKRIRHIQLHRPRFIYTRVSSSNRVSPFRCLVVVVVVSIAAAVVYSQPNASIQTIEIPTYSIFFSLYIVATAAAAVVVVRSFLIILTEPTIFSIVELSLCLTTRIDSARLQFYGWRFSFHELSTQMVFVSVVHGFACYYVMFYDNYFSWCAKQRKLK